jgi:hypothetical protein
MKRSEINKIIKDAIKFFKKMHFKLPPFAYFTIDDWQKHKNDAKEIFDLNLGWDITDFGSNDFYRKGLLLFTLRNGLISNPLYPKTYAEKIMVVEEDQVTPMHFHWNKMEDIINRGGGNLVVEIYGSAKNEEPDNTMVDISIDGINKKIISGDKVILSPGESISLTQNIYHKFYGQKGKGKVLVGEVSMVNDDDNDNRFYEETRRFPDIIEDAEPVHLLCKDYRKFLL